MRVVVTQPYLPSYRVALFAELARLLEQDGHELLVLFGQSTGAQRARGDSTDAVTGLKWAAPIRTFTFSLGGRNLRLRRLGLTLGPSDVLVTELDASNLTAWLQLFRPRRRFSVIGWGHGRSYVGPELRSVSFLKRVLYRRFDTAMTYSDSGARSLIDRHGLTRSRVVAIGNSTDTRKLRREFIHHKTNDKTDIDFRRHHAAYLGGLDADKRIGFLAEAARAAWRSDSEFVLHIGGAGADKDLLDEGIAAGYIAYEGVVTRDAAAEFLARVVCIWNPGRVGLVAVDALAVGLRVYTTDYAFHAPEYEMLTEADKRVLPDDPRAFGEQAIAMMREDVLTAGQLLRLDVPSVQNVAAAMTRCFLRAGVAYGQLDRIAR